MGIGSFFASLFQKDADRQKEIRELNIEKESKELTSVTKKGGQVQKKSLEVREQENLNGTESSREKTESSREKTESSREKTESSREKTESSREKTESSRENIEDSRENIEDSREKTEKKEYFQAKKELYHYLNQTLKALFEADRNHSWEELPSLEGPSKKAVSCLERVNEELPDNLKSLLQPFVEESGIANPSGLRQAYLDMLLPFYPAYSEEFDEFRYNTFLNRDALELFRRLTGRKYRLGYRNRYSTGVTAFEWQGDQYKVYNKKGLLLCDATFEHGEVKDGYAVKVLEEPEGSDWDVLKKGSFHDGEFSEGALEYIYKKPVGVL